MQSTGRRVLRCMTTARGATWSPWKMSRTRRPTRSHERNLLSIARSSRARSRARSASCRRTRIAQTSLTLSGAFWPRSLPLFQGCAARVGADDSSMTLSERCGGSHSFPPSGGLVRGHRASPEAVILRRFRCESVDPRGERKRCSFDPERCCRGHLSGQRARRLRLPRWDDVAELRARLPFGFDRLTTFVRQVHRLPNELGARDIARTVREDAFRRHANDKLGARELARQGISCDDSCLTVDA